MDDNYFLQVFRQWRSHISDEIFETVPKEAQQVREIYNANKSSKFYSKTSVENFFHSKCPQKSKQLREEGNKLFQKKAFDEALDAFSQAIRHSPYQDATQPKDEPIMAYALANRSAVFFHTKKYDSCIKDIEESLRQGYPDHLKYKLYERKAKSLLQLQKRDEAILVYNQTLDLIELSNLDENTRTKWKNSLREKQAEIHKKQTSKSKTLEEGKWELPVTTGEKSTKFTCTSNAFDILYNEEIGRDIVAGTAVHVGDVLGVEKPYMTVLNWDHVTKACDHCSAEAIAFLPCRNCSDAIYCSRECESESWTEYHRVECTFSSWMRTISPESSSSNLGRITQLALRISLKAGYENLKRYFNQDEENISGLEAGFTDGVYLNDYHSVFHMASNKKSRPLRVSKDYAVLAAMTIQLLESSQFFCKLAESVGKTQGRSKETITNTRTKDQPHNGLNVSSECNNVEEMVDETEELKLLYAASLVHHMQIIQCNAYGVVEADIPSAGFRMKEAIYSGLALYPTMGLINHSCDPVLDISFNGSIAIYRAYTNVKQGDQITVDYGPIYYLQEKEERQAHLKDNYYFDCKCPPCALNWPMWENIESKVPRLKCPICDETFPTDVAIVSCVTCSKCTQNIELLKFLRELGESHKNYSVAMQEAKEGKSRQALPILKTHLTLMQKVIALPWREFITCQAVIDQCYRMEASYPNN